MSFLPKGQSGFAHIFIIFLVGFLILGGGGFYYFASQQNYVSPESRLPNFLPTPKPTLNPFKVYTNSEYNFEITYPSTGLIQDGANQSVGECGNTIKQITPIGKIYQDMYAVDNLYNLAIQSFDDSIKDYLTQNRALNIYNFSAIKGSNADEAIALDGLKKDVEFSNFPPLAFVASIYKKDDNLFLIMTTQNPGNAGGCLRPDILNPVQYKDLVDLKWDYKRSLKFLTPSIVQLANPASVYCKDQGGVSEIVSNADGSQGGVCKFGDGKTCDEWALFRGECKK